MTWSENSAALAYILMRRPVKISLWVIGSLLAVIDMPLEVGYLVIVIVSGFAAFSYVVGLLSARQRSGAQPTVATAAATEIEARMNSAGAEARQRFLNALTSARRRMGRGSHPAPPSERPPSRSG